MVPPPPHAPAAAAAACAGRQGRGTPTDLPPDFLRLPGRPHPAGGAAPAAAAGGPLLSDEQLARMLQDKLFQEELRHNPEFSHLAGRRRGGGARGGGRAGAGYPGGGAGTSINPSGHAVLPPPPEIFDQAFPLTLQAYSFTCGHVR